MDSINIASGATCQPFFAKSGSAIIINPVGGATVTVTTCAQTNILTPAPTFSSANGGTFTAISTLVFGQDLWVKIASASGSCTITRIDDYKMPVVKAGYSFPGTVDNSRPGNHLGSMTYSDAISALSGSGIPDNTKVFITDANSEYFVKGSKLYPSTQASPHKSNAGFCYQENLTVIQNVETDIFNTTTSSITDPGQVSYIQIIGEHDSCIRDTVIKIYTDGSNTPDVNMDLHSFGTLFISAAEAWTQHVQVSVNRRVCIMFPIYFYSGCRITLTNPSGSYHYYNTVICNLGDTKPLRLKNAGRTWANRDFVVDCRPVANGGGGPYSLASVASGSGVIVWQMLGTQVGNGNTIGGNSVASSNDGFSYLEANLNIYNYNDTVGVSPGIYKTTGTEDWAQSCYYFAPGITSNPIRMISRLGGGFGAGDYGVTVGVDYLAMCGGIRFTNGFKWIMEATSLDAGQMKTGPNLMCMTLYYLNV